MQALEDLDYLAALDDNGHLSDLGVILSEFPLPPELAKALLASCEFECVDEMLTLAAMLTGMIHLSPWLLWLRQAFPGCCGALRRLALSPELQFPPHDAYRTRFHQYPSSVSLAFFFGWFFLSACLNLFYLLLLKLFSPLLQPYTPLQLDGIISILFHLG